MACPSWRVTDEVGCPWCVLFLSSHIDEVDFPWRVLLGALVTMFRSSRSFGKFAVPHRPKSDHWSFGSS